MFGLPIYKSLYTGKSVFAEDERFYLINGEVYARLISLNISDKHGNERLCQTYVDGGFLNEVLTDGSKYPHIGNMADYRGSEMSSVMQSLVGYLNRKPVEEMKKGLCYEG